MDDPYHLYKARCEDIVGVDCLDLHVDLGFRLTNRLYADLVGIEADPTPTDPDDLEPDQRGTEQRQYVVDWITAASVKYEGDDNLPLAVRTIRPAGDDYERYQVSVFSRHSHRSLNDEFRAEFPGAVR